MFDRAIKGVAENQKSESTGSDNSNRRNVLAVEFYLRRTRLPGNPVDDYEVFDANRRVVGRIMFNPQAPKDRPWFWTITRGMPPSVYNRGYSATRGKAMADFKERWMNSQKSDARRVEP